MIGTRRRPGERHIQHVRLDRLTPHPLNEKLYGSAPDRNLIDSIRLLGIIEPLIVTQRGQIISGHSRWQAAKIICAEDGVSEKTVYLMTMRPDHSPNGAWYVDLAHAENEDANPLLLEKFLIESNRQRVKTESQKDAEAAHLLRIETELAAIRQRAGVRTNSAEGGKAVEKVAATTGESADTVRKRAAIHAEAVNPTERNKQSTSHAFENLPKPTVCDVCGVSFESKGAMKNHRKLAHAAEMEKRRPVPGPSDALPSSLSLQDADATAALQVPPASGGSTPTLSLQSYERLLASISQRILARNGADQEYSKDDNEPLGWRSRNTVRVRITKIIHNMEDRRTFWFELSRLLWSHGWEGNTVFRENRREAWIFHWAHPKAQPERPQEMPEDWSPQTGCAPVYPDSTTVVEGSESPEKNPELVAKIQAHEKAAIALMVLLKENGIDAKVSRSKTNGKFHVTWHDATAEQVQKFAETFKP
jgi:hypothetical protein